MKNGKTFVLIALGAASLLVLLLPAVNLYVDPSRALSRDVEHSYKWRESNLMFQKAAYLLEHAEDYDSLIFGSSRTWYGINLEVLGEKLGGRWFRMEYSGGMPMDHLYNLKLLQAKGKQFQKIILTIDDFALHETHDHAQDYYYRPYPRTLFDWLDFYYFYLFKKPTWAEFAMLVGDHPLLPYERISGNREGLITEKKGKITRLSPVNSPLGRTDRAAKLLEEVAAFKDICDEMGAELTIVFMPAHYKILTSRDYDSVEFFKRGLASISPYYDFTSLASFLWEEASWREVLHFFPVIGDEVISRLAQEERSNSAFGVVVTPSNVEPHLNQFRKDLYATLPRLLMMDRRGWVHPSLLTPLEGAASGIDLIEKTQDVILREVEGRIWGEVTGPRPMLWLRRQIVPAGRLGLLEVALEVKETEKANIILRFEKGAALFEEEQVYRRPLLQTPEDNLFHVPIGPEWKDQSLTMRLRGDFTTFRIDQLRVASIPDRAPRGLN